MSNKIINAIKTAHEEYQALKGGSGSGNFGHSGRPGKIGGSAGGSMINGIQEPVIDKSLGMTKRMHKYYADLLKMPKQDLEKLVMHKLGIADTYDEEGVKKLSQQIGNGKSKLAGALLASNFGDYAASEVQREYRMSNWK